MASVTENAILIASIQAELANSVRLSAMSASQRRELLDALPAGIVAKKYGYSNIKAGDSIYGKDPAINTGGWFFGVANVDNPTSDAQITFEVKF